MAKLLIFGNANRKDYVEQFKVPAQEHEITWIHFSEGKIDQRELYGVKIVPITKFWSIQHIFNRYKPDHLVLFHLASDIDALAILEAKSRGIKTWFIDHGISFFPPSYYGRKDRKSLNDKSQKKFKKLIPFSIHYNFFVYFSSLGLKHQKLFGKYKTCRRTSASSQFIYAKIGEEYASNFLPDEFIAYSKHNWRVFEWRYLRLIKSRPKVSYIGIPIFDKYYTNKLGDNLNAIIIDQPLYRYDLTVNEYKEFIQDTVFTLQDEGYEVFIKPHPASDFQIFESIKNLSIVNKLENISEYALCVGFFSTLLLPFIANKVPTLTYDTKIFTHPLFFETNQLTSFFSNQNELKIKLSQNHSVDNENLEEIFFKFDGKSGNRLKQLFDEF